MYRLITLSSAIIMALSLGGAGSVAQARTVHHHPHVVHTIHGHYHIWYPSAVKSHNTSYVTNEDVNMRNRMNYVSQLSPMYMPDACELGSLKMALEIKGHAVNTSLYDMVENTHWQDDGNPNFDYSGSPFYKHGATIYPLGMLKVAREYGGDGYIKDYANRYDFIHALQHGNPVVVEAGHKVHVDSDHIIVLIGYRHQTREHPAQFEYADPYSRSPLIGWASVNWFMHVYSRPFVTGERALVIDK